MKNEKSIIILKIIQNIIYLTVKRKNCIEKVSVCAIMLFIVLLFYVSSLICVVLSKSDKYQLIKFDTTTKHSEKCILFHWYF